ncbi:MAG: hypothetical protein KJO39_11790 [Bacteroidia bacterium]|nr:hypothetical protein [Bacteroidia bacterium]NNF31764.1 hypothetical protein [Flavobacteriaceae bacterium]NNK55278.1 hypothetical protein [Flavobacteriaceae bacterium]NNM10273.1 hypothetical protein [Flavobacteriaceae bacterium]
MRNVLILLISVICIVGCMDIGKYDNPEYGTLDIRKIESSQDINGYPCKKGKVTFYENDSLMNFVLYEDFVINNDMIPADSDITMYWNGKPEFIYLSKETEIQGYIPTAKRIAYWHVSFYNNGKLHLFSLKDDTHIAGVPCQKGDDLRLFPNGDLWECTLSEDFEIEGKKFSSGAHLIFDEKGQVYNFSLSRYNEIKDRLKIHEFTKRFYSNKL